MLYVKIYLVLQRSCFNFFLNTRTPGKNQIIKYQYMNYYKYVLILIFIYVLNYEVNF